MICKEKLLNLVAINFVQKLMMWNRPK